MKRKKIKEKNEAKELEEKRGKWIKKQKTAVLVFIFLIGSLFIFFIGNICSGSVVISVFDIADCFLGRETKEIVRNIFWEIRFPRALAATVLGGALGLSGYLLQTFFHNPIAGPFVLGISSGAKLAVALVMVFLLSQRGRIGSGMMILAAFIGALVSMGFVLFMAKKVNQMSMLIVSGVMIGYICSAITDFVVTFADDADIVNLHNWSKGSFSGISWENVAVILSVVFPAALAVFLLSKPISAYQLGESYAKSMGVNIWHLRILMVLLSSFLSACIVAFAGPVSFVGIAVPHMVKILLHTERPILMIPACFLGGGGFCLFCDLLARTIFAPTELSISTVTAVFGAPVVIAVMAGRRKERG